jgi:hypothetical protein
MARTRNIDKYPLEAYIAMFTAARAFANTGKIYPLSCANRKEAIRRRFEFYTFLRALNKSPEAAHQHMAQEFRGFKLTLLSTGKGEETLIQFEAWDKTALALDIMAQVKTALEAAGLNESAPAETGAQAPVPLRDSSTHPEVRTEGLTEGENAQTAAMRKMGLIP